MSKLAQNVSKAVAGVRSGLLTKYDPRKGIKKIAVLEMAEKHFARAKDATKLQEAIRAKLEAQREFVDWWDTHGPGVKRGAPKGNRNAQKSATEQR